MARRFPVPDAPSPHVLTPFDAREALSVAEAAAMAGLSLSQTRRLVDLYDVGRRVCGGNWRVSRVAWRMVLDGDVRAWRAYRDGRHDDQSVRAYFSAAGLSPQK